MLPLFHTKLKAVVYNYIYVCHFYILKVDVNTVLSTHPVTALLYVHVINLQSTGNRNSIILCHVVLIERCGHVRASCTSLRNKEWKPIYWAASADNTIIVFK